MKSSEDIQAALLTYLKAQTSITGLLSDTNEIREDQWQARNFIYPNVRIDLGIQRPELSHGCPSSVTGSVLCFSDQNSSKQADDMAGAAAATLHQKAFTRGGIRFSMMRVTDLVPAIRVDDRTWRSQVIFQAILE